MDGNDIFGEIDDQDNGVEIKEHVPDKHENDYLECDFNFLSEQRCIEDFDLNLLNQNTAKAEEIQYSMPMNYQVKIETVSHTIVLKLMNHQLNIVLFVFIINRKDFMLVNMLSTHIGRCQRMFQYLNSTYIRPYHLHALPIYPRHHRQHHSIPYHQVAHKSSQNVDVSLKIGITAMSSEA